MELKIGIKADNLKTISQILSGFLSDEVILYTKTKNAHWNIEGNDFHEKHLFFQNQYEQLDQLIDDIAERIRTLGHYAPATLHSYLQLTHLTEVSRENNHGTGFVKELLTDHESIAIRLREQIEMINTEFRDYGTADFLTGLLEKHEKIAWMLRAQLTRV